MVRRSAADGDELVELRKRLEEAEASLEAVRANTAPPPSGLREGHADFAADIVASLPEGVAVVECDVIAFANPKLAHLLGAATPSEVVGRALGRDGVLAADDDHGGWHTERWVRLDSGTVELEVSRKDITKEHPKRQLVIARDAGVSTQLQAQLLQADRLAAIGSLAAGVAHQINNPLAYVMANLAFLGEELPEINRLLAGGKGDPAELEARASEASHALVEAREGAERVAAIVRDLKMLSRIDDDRREPLDLGRLLDSAYNVASTELGIARLVRSYDPAPQVAGNESRLGHVFVNLILNAAHAIREAGEGPHEVKLATSTDARGRAVIEVSDTGTGITPSALARIFDPFFTTKPIGIGVGLGLTTALGIIGAMRGTIEVFTELGRGSTFRVTLPAYDQENARFTTPTLRPSPIMAPRPRVLIVDDESTLTTALRRALVRDVEVEIRSSGPEALLLLQHDDRFDVVLCDIMMPEMTGIEIYDVVFAKNPALAARFVFMTGGAFTPSTREFLDHVENARLEKPFDLKHLRRIIRERAAVAGRH